MVTDPRAGARLTLTDIRGLGWRLGTRRHSHYGKCRVQGHRLEYTTSNLIYVAFGGRQIDTSIVTICILRFEVKRVHNKRKCDYYRVHIIHVAIIQIKKRKNAVDLSRQDNISPN